MLKIMFKMVRRDTLFFFGKTDADGKEPVCSQNQIKACEAQKLVNFSVMSAILIKKITTSPHKPCISGLASWST